MKFTRHLTLGLTTAGLALTAAPVFADVTAGSSSGSALSVDLSALDGAVTADINEPNDTNGSPIAGTAPAPYGVSSGLINVDTTVGAEVNLVAADVDLDLAGVDGVVTANAVSDVDAAPGNRAAAASAGVNGLDLNVGNADVTVALLGTQSVSALSADSLTLSSEASVTGDYNNLVASGDSTIENFTLTLLNQDFLLSDVLDIDADAGALLDIAPNTEATISVGDLANVGLFLNEQTITGDGVSERGISVNALRLDVEVADSVLGINLDLADGSIVIGHSEAQLSAVPEPASLALLGLSGGAMMLRRRRTIR